MKKRSKTKKSLMAPVVTLAMILAWLPATGQAAQTLSYIDESGVGRTASATAISTLITDPITSITLDTGWYVADTDLTLPGITINGDVNLILMDGVILTVSGGSAGINVSGTNRLTIYGQSLGTGTLHATGGSHGAGIGGGDGGNCGTVNIYGGMIDANGGSYGAGIGGGYNGDGGVATISGSSTVTTTGGAGSAGIGGGYCGAGGTITISGNATVASAGGGDPGTSTGGTGIGSGGMGGSATVNIYGGTVHAQGGVNGAGIGGNACTITISGSAIVATEGDGNGAGIGGSWGNNGGTITIFGGTITASSGGIGGEAVGIGAGGTSKTVNIAPSSGVSIDVYVGSAAPGSRLAGSPFTVSTPYTGSHVYFRSTVVKKAKSAKVKFASVAQTLNDPATGVTVSGVFRSGTTLSVGDIHMHEPGDCPACDTIRAARQDSDLTYVLWMDISLSRDCDGPFTVTIPVGVQYEGQTLTILHCADGVLEPYTAVVRDGNMTIIVDSLSPLAVFTSGGLDDVPKTGDANSVLIWWLLCGVSAVGMAAMLLWIRKNHAGKGEKHA